MGHHFCAINRTPLVESSYGAIWGLTPTDVWIGGRGLVHWDGTVFVGADLPLFDVVEDISGTGGANVWAITRKGKVLHYNGESWAVVHVVAGEGSDIHARAPNDVWVAADSLFHFDGIQWTEFAEGMFAERVFGTDVNEVYFANTYGFVYRIVGGGAPEQVFFNSADAVLLHALDVDDIWYFHQSGGAHYDGATWTPVALPGISYLLGASVVSGNDIYLSDSYRTYHFDGVELVEINAELYQSGSNVQGFPGSRAIVVSDRVFAYDNGSWTTLSSVAVSVMPLLAFSEDDVLMSDGVRFNGTQLVTTPGLTLPDQGAWGLTPESVFFPTSYDVIRRWNGSSIEEISAPGVELGPIFGFSDDDFWVTGDGGLMHVLNGLPEVVAMPFATRVNTLWGAQPEDLWIGADAGIFHWDGNEVTLWRRALVTKLHGSSATDVWAVEPAQSQQLPGHVLHFDGTDWTPLDMGRWYSFSVRDVFVQSAQDVWLGGSDLVSGVHLLHFNGAGLDPVDTGTVSGVERLAVTPGGTVFASTATSLVRRPGTAGEIGGAAAPYSSLRRRCPPDTSYVSPSFNNQVASCPAADWCVEQPGKTSGYLSVHGTDGSSVWIGSAEGILHWDGTTLALDGPRTAKNSGHVLAFSQEDVWVSGTPDVFRGTAEGWMKFIVPFVGNEVTDMLGTSSSNVYMFIRNLYATDNRLIHWDGSSWSSVFNGVSEPADMSISPEGTLWMLRSGNLQKVEGVTVTTVTTASGANVVALADDDVWIGGRERWNGASKVPVPAVDPDNYGYVTVLWGQAGVVYGTYDDVLYRGDGTTWTAEREAAGITAMWGVDPDNVWAVGGSRILRRDASGWEQLTSISYQRLSSVWAWDESFVVAGGVSSVVGMKENGIWKNLRLPRDGLTHVAALGSTLVFGGANGVTFHDENPVRHEPIGEVADLVGTPDGTLWAATLDHVLRFADGHWREIRTNTTEVKSLHATAANDAWLADYRVRRWDGTDWTELPALPANGSPRDVWSTGAGTVWALTSASHLAHWDGQQWTDAAPPASTYLYTMCVVGSGTVFAGGAGGVIVSHSAGSWQELHRASALSSFSHSHCSGDTAWFVSDTGRLFSVQDTSVVEHPVDVPVLDVVASNNVTGALGELGAVVRFDGAGFVTEEQPWLTGDVVSILGFSPEDIWAAGDEGTVMHWDGSTWEPRSLQFGYDPVRLFGGSPDSVYAASHSVYRWNGASWDMIPSFSFAVGGWALEGEALWVWRNDGTLHRLENNVATYVIGDEEFGVRAVSGTSPFDVWVVGTGGRVVRFDGNVFEDVPTGVDPDIDLLAVDAVNENNVWVAGEKQVLLQWVGNRWRLRSPPVYTNYPAPDAPAFTAVSVGYDGIAYAVDASGSVQRFLP